MRLFILPEETVPDEEFGTLRRPEGTGSLNAHWVAKDLGSHFLVLADGDKVTVDTLTKVSGGVELNDIDEAATKLGAQVLKDKVAAAKPDLVSGKINI